MSVTEINYFLCGNKAKSIPTDGDFKNINCVICGDIFVSDSYYACIAQNPNLLSEKEKIALRYYYKNHTLKNKNNSNKAETLSTHTIESIISSINYPSSILRKIDGVLEYIYHKTEFFKDEVNIDLKTDYPLFFCIWSLPADENGSDHTEGSPPQSDLQKSH